MKEEYDFTNAEQGKFYRPIEELQIPIYLDSDIQKVLMKKVKDASNKFSLNGIVNDKIQTIERCLKGIREEYVGYEESFVKDIFSGYFGNKKIHIPL